MRKVRVERTRKFCPHHLLIRVALGARDRADEKEDGWYYDALAAMTFAALASEAVANSFGERLIPDWNDFETAKPVAKFRVICAHLKMDVTLSKEPWASIAWLTGFRNLVAHAKPKVLKSKRDLPAQAYEKHLYDYPQSALESEVTKGNAKRAVAAVETILAELCNKLPPEELEGLFSDSWSGSVSSIPTDEADSSAG